MPQSINYSLVLPLISTSRLSSYITTFKLTSNHEIYGTYIWSQQAAAAIYPLLQNLEITLRNAIDKEAKRRFGIYWWDAIGFSGQKNQHNFYKKIQNAKDNLQSNWIKEQRKKKAPINHPPMWSHDQIIAATDFSAWHFILTNEFNTTNRNNSNPYLWPSSLGNVFKQYHLINNNQHSVRSDIMNLVSELREYRNRLFHHEPIWIKSKNVVNSRTAIDTIRNKIKKIENLIQAIEPDKHAALTRLGLFKNALRICSYEELCIYNYSKKYTLLTKKQKKNLRNISSKSVSNNTTEIYHYGDNTFSLHVLRNN